MDMNIVDNVINGAMLMLIFIGHRMSSAMLCMKDEFERHVGDVVEALNLLPLLYRDSVHLNNGGDRVESDHQTVYLHDIIRNHSGSSSDRLLKETKNIAIVKDSNCYIKAFYLIISLNGTLTMAELDVLNASYEISVRQLAEAINR